MKQSERERPRKEDFLWVMESNIFQKLYSLEKLLDSRERVLP